jgi:tripartite-type tricarboxylate transporter receptor subunit TctC
MKSSRRDVLAGATAMAAASLLSGMARAAWPDRQVRIIAPAAPGGALDLISRILANKASAILGQAAFVENRPGANMMIGMDAVAKSSPDGYTLLLVSSSAITVNPYVFDSMPLDPFRDLAPILSATITPYACLLNPSLPARTVPEFIAYLKANPGKLNHASNSAATMLVSGLFKFNADVEYADVNYRGASQAINDTIGGHTQFCFVDIGSASVPIKGKTLRPLAITTPTKFDLFPELAVFAESGLPAFSVMGRTILAAPAGTSADLLAALNARFRAALDAPEVTAQLRGMGQIVGGGTPDETVAILRDEASQWEKLIKARHIHFSP